MISSFDRFCLSTALYISISVRLPRYPSNYLTVNLFVCQPLSHSAPLSVDIFLSISLPISRPFYTSLYPVHYILLLFFVSFRPYFPLFTQSPFPSWIRSSSDFVTPREARTAPRTEGDAGTVVLSCLHNTKGNTLLPSLMVCVLLPKVLHAFPMGAIDDTESTMPTLGILLPFCELPRVWEYMGEAI